jgi:hypothetical protein
VPNASSSIRAASRQRAGAASPIRSEFGSQPEHRIAFCDSLFSALWSGDDEVPGVRGRAEPRCWLVVRD